MNSNLSAALLSLSALAGLAASASAQSNEIISLYDNGFRYQIGGIIPWDSSNRNNVTMGSVAIQYTISGTTETWSPRFGPCDSASDHLFNGHINESWACTQHWWWYRGTGDTREYSISNQTSYVMNGLNELTVTYSEPVAGVADALRFTFVYTLTGQIAGPNTALLNVAVRIENTSTATQAVNLFNYADLNAGGLTSPSDDVWSYQSLPHRSQFLVFNSPTSSDPFLTYGARGTRDIQNSRWAASNSSPIGNRNRFGDTQVQDLALLNTQSWPMTTNPASYSGMLQFQRTLAPGEVYNGAVYIGYRYILPNTCTSDVNSDGDFGTDADIEAFFACLAGNCCPTCASPDFNGDGDFGTDADIEAFFRVLAGMAC